MFMSRISTERPTSFLLTGALSLLLTLVGCATNKDKLLPHGTATMLDVWNQETGGPPSATGANPELIDAREVLRRPLIEGRVPDLRSGDYTRTAENEIHRLFVRLPNPDLVMYVFPHLSGTESVPVPGYSTVFPFYERVEYAMPGERTEDF
jgi:conjugative transfer region lipoprotein (TIGR03751 family)